LKFQNYLKSGPGQGLLSGQSQLHVEITEGIDGQYIAVLLRNGKGGSGLLIEDQLTPLEDLAVDFECIGGHDKAGELYGTTSRVDSYNLPPPSKL
jgi:hypothetical protein